MTAKTNTFLQIHYSGFLRDNQLIPIEPKCRAEAVCKHSGKKKHDVAELQVKNAQIQTLCNQAPSTYYVFCTITTVNETNNRFSK
jgi:hypothetical protein